MEAYLVDKIKRINTKKSMPRAFGVAFYNFITPWIISFLICKLIVISDFIYLLFPFVSIYIGTRCRAINNMSHECIHFSFCKNRKLNEFFGEIFAIFKVSIYQERTFNSS